MLPFPAPVELLEAADETSICGAFFDFESVLIIYGAFFKMADFFFCFKVCFLTIFYSFKLLDFFIPDGSDLSEPSRVY